MPNTTPNMGLEKPIPGSEYIPDGIVDINENFDKLDLQPGVYICTSATRPAGFNGRRIYETDTKLTYRYNSTLAAYVPEKPIRYVLADADWKNLTASTSSRVIADLVVPQATYPRKAYIHARVSVISGAISSGTLKEDVCVSALTSTVGSAQGRSRLIFNSTNAAQYQTATVDCEVDIPANTDPLIRCWLYNVDAAAVTAQATNGAFAFMYAELRADE